MSFGFCLFGRLCMRNRLYKHVTKDDTNVTPEWFDKLDEEWSVRQNVNR